MDIDKNNSVTIISSPQDKIAKDIPENLALTKADLAHLLYTQVGLNKREAKEIIDEFFEAIGGALEHGQEVKLSGFGSFLLREKKQRPGRNPKTGEVVPVSARRVVVFHASHKLKEQVNTNSSVEGASFAPSSELSETNSRTDS
jgi:integration host factor subunit alpha